MDARRKTVWVVMIERPMHSFPLLISVHETKAGADRELIRVYGTIWVEDSHVNKLVVHERFLGD